MWIEKSYLNDDERKKAELSEKEVKDNQKKILEHQKVKEKIRTEVQAEEDLMNLKDLVEKWVISQDTAEQITDWMDLDEETIQEIFDKIDEIEEIKDVDQYIPEDLRITKEDYSKALQDDIFRLQTITKLDSALVILANKITPDSAMWINLFSWFLTVLDKNLIKVQENTIDVKDSLKEIDEKKHGKKEDNRSLWQKIIDFIKEVSK